MLPSSKNEEQFAALKRRDMRRWIRSQIPSELHHGLLSMDEVQLASMINWIINQDQSVISD